MNDDAEPADLLAAPAMVTAAAMTAKTRPAMMRLRIPLALGGAYSSRIAATGGIFAARRAGVNAASRVTIVPSRMVMMIVRADITSPPAGRPRFNASSRACNP